MIDDAKTMVVGKFYGFVYQVLTSLYYLVHEIGIIVQLG